MSRARVGIAGALCAVVIGLLGWTMRPRPHQTDALDEAGMAASHAPLAIAGERGERGASPSLPDAAVTSDIAIDAVLRTLPSEDADWVLRQIEAREAVRPLDDATRLQLATELASIRQFTIHERQAVLDPVDDSLDLPASEVTP